MPFVPKLSELISLLSILHTVPLAILSITYLWAMYFLCDESQTWVNSNFSNGSAQVFTFHLFNIE